MNRAIAVTATLIVLAGCGDDARANQGHSAREAFNAASEAADATHQQEFGTPSSKPVTKAPTKTPTATAKSNPHESMPKGRPDWADQVPQQDGKLFAVGSAPRGRREAAAASARKELAAQLRVHIEGKSTTIQTEVTTIGPGGERVGKAMAQFRDEATSSVNRELDCTRIVAESEDEKTSWALLELDRVAWATKLRQEIGQVDQKLGAERDHVAAASSGIRAAAQAMRAVGKLAARREALVSDLIQAEPATTPPTCPIDLKALFNTCAKQLAAVTMKLEGAEDAVFAARVQDAMAAVGLTVNEKSAPLILRLALRQNPVKTPSGWTRVNVAGSATVVDPASGAVMGSLQIDTSGTDADAAQAKSKMLDNAATELAEQVSTRLIDLIGQ